MATAPTLTSPSSRPIHTKSHHRTTPSEPPASPVETTTPSQFSLPHSLSHSSTPVTRGSWTPREHQLFIEALERYGRDWRRISDAMQNTRTTKQVRSHAQKYFLRVQRTKMCPLAKIRTLRAKSYPPLPTFPSPCFSSHDMLQSPPIQTTQDPPVHEEQKHPQSPTSQQRHHPSDNSHQSLVNVSASSSMSSSHLDATTSQQPATSISTQRIDTMVTSSHDLPNWSLDLPPDHRYPDWHSEFEGAKLMSADTQHYQSVLDIPPYNDLCSSVLEEDNSWDALWHQEQAESLSLRTIPF